MLTPRDEERLDEAVERLGRTIRALHSRQAHLERRLVGLYRIAFAGFTLVVVTVSSLVIILSRQVPDMTVAMRDMNGRFASVAADMARVERTIESMTGHVAALPEIVASVDGIQGSTAAMRADVTQMAGTLSAIDADLAAVALGVADMRLSFEVMSAGVARMGRDVGHMSGPFRLFNRMNPLR
ncbi:MAG: hypothetical protein MUF66_05935 [Gammaproteobacteria bacterium]|nr:hypothetical protein [Gammaproteobacteria bacterium]